MDCIAHLTNNVKLGPRTIIPSWAYFWYESICLGMAYPFCNSEIKSKLSNLFGLNQVRWTIFFFKFTFIHFDPMGCMTQLK